MEKTLTLFLELAIGKVIWDTRQRVASSFAFEVGSPVEETRGQFHFVINQCHWWLQQGQGKEFQDVVNSESNQSNIADKLEILNGKQLLHIQFNEEISSTILDFDDNIYLKITPYASRTVVPQWQVFTPTRILNLMSDGKVEIENL